MKLLVRSLMLSVGVLTAVIQGQRCQNNRQCRDEGRLATISRSLAPESNVQVANAMEQVGDLATNLFVVSTALSGADIAGVFAAAATGTVARVVGALSIVGSIAGALIGILSAFLGSQPNLSLIIQDALDSVTDQVQREFVRQDFQEQFDLFSEVAANLELADRAVGGMSDTTNVADAARAAVYVGEARSACRQFFGTKNIPTSGRVFSTLRRSAEVDLMVAPLFCDSCTTVYLTSLFTSLAAGADSSLASDTEQLEHIAESCAFELPARFAELLDDRIGLVRPVVRDRNVVSLRDGGVGEVFRFDCERAPCECSRSSNGLEGPECNNNSQNCRSLTSSRNMPCRDRSIVGRSRSHSGEVLGEFYRGIRILEVHKSVVQQFRPSLFPLMETFSGMLASLHNSKLVVNNVDAIEMADRGLNGGTEYYLVSREVGGFLGVVRSGSQTAPGIVRGRAKVRIADAGRGRVRVIVGNEGILKLSRTRTQQITDSWTRGNNMGPFFSYDGDSRGPVAPLLGVAPPTSPDDGLFDIVFVRDSRFNKEFHFYLGALERNDEGELRIMSYVFPSGAARVLRAFPSNDFHVIEPPLNMGGFGSFGRFSGRTSQPFIEVPARPFSGRPGWQLFRA